MKPCSPKTTLLLSLTFLTIACRSTKSHANAVPPARPAAPVTSVDMGALTEPKRLLRGFIDADKYWKWTQPTFAVALDRPQTVGSPTYFEMDFNLMPQVIVQPGDSIVIVRANGVEVCKKTYKEPGRRLLLCQVPENALATEPVVVEVESNKWIRDPDPGPEKSLIVVSMGLKEYEATAEFETLQSERPARAMDRVAEHWKPVPAGTIRGMTDWAFKSDMAMNTRFQGISIVKIPVDLWMMQQIIYDIKPDFIVETGTYKGGSALYFAWLMQSMNLPGRVLTVDIEDLHQGAVDNPLWKNYVDFYLGSSTDPALVKRIADRVKGRRVLVGLDSDHHMLHVLRELKLYGPLVSSGSYLFVEDTQLDGVPTIQDLRTGPMAAVEQFLAINKDFERDYSREVVPSFYHGGWLRRK